MHKVVKWLARGYAGGRSLTEAEGVWELPSPTPVPSAVAQYTLYWPTGQTHLSRCLLGQLCLSKGRDPLLQS